VHEKENYPYRTQASTDWPAAKRAGNNQQSRKTPANACRVLRDAARIFVTPDHGKFWHGKRVRISISPRR